MSEFKKIAETGDIQPGHAKCFQMNGEDIAIANVNGQFFAFTDICTHADASLTEGGCPLIGDLIECPLHQARFNVKTGAVTDPPAFDDLKTYELMISGTDILVKL